MSKLDLIAPDTAEAALSRRSLVQTIAGTALAMTFLAGCGGSDDDDNNNGGGGTTDGTSLDTAILQFALNLEYLEAEFYSFAVNGAGIPASLYTGTIGSPQATTGGVRTNFSTPNYEAVAREIANDELNHVKFLRGVLQSRNALIAKPRIELNPLGLNLSTEAGYITLARAFEDTGVSAYLGAAGAISDKGILSAAAAILSVEALHTGNIRLQQVASGNTSTFALDAKDQPATSSNFFVTTPDNSLSVPRTPREVLAIVYGNNTQTPGAFFPQGVNLGAGNAARLLALG